MFKFLSLTVLSCVLLHCGAFNDVQTKFREDEIVPDVLEDVPELKTLKISYPSGVSVDMGNVLTPTQVKDQPTVEYEAEAGAFYTLLMTDPDAPSRQKPERREFRHWLLVNIEGNDLSTGEQAFQFIGSGPPKDTGLHRYVFLLFKQPNGKITYDAPHVSDHSAQGRPTTSTRKLISDFDLKLIAGNFYQAEYDDYVPTLHAQLSGKPKSD